MSKCSKCHKDYILKFYDLRNSSKCGPSYNFLGDLTGNCTNVEYDKKNIEWGFGYFSIGTFSIVTLM